MKTRISLNKEGNMKQASFSNYGQYSSDNYGAHSLRFTTNDGSFYFSYQTLIAFRAYTEKARKNNLSGTLFVHENDWGPATGKHLNWIDGGDKQNRLSDEQFNRIYSECFDA